MGKRSDFVRVEKDFYPTPIEAVKPLIPHLPKDKFEYIEPCAGDGRLVDHISVLTEGRADCILLSDIEPRRDDILIKDVIEYRDIDKKPDLFITNPPWSRNILHPIIEILSNVSPTWLLYDADWLHTKQSSTLMKFCVKIVSVGRVKWIPDSKMTGKDNCAWYLFDAKHDSSHATQFFGR